MAYNVATKSQRAPTVAIPGSKGSGRPAAQKGGGGNRAAGSVEPTAANSPTVTVSRDGSVTAEHFSPSKAGEAAAQVAVARQQAAEAHTRRVVALVTSKPKTTAPVAKGTSPTKPQIETRPAISAPPKQAKALAEAIGLGPKTPAGKETKLVTVAAHTRKAPEPKATKLAGSGPERKKARQNLRQATAALHQGQSKARLASPIVTTPEQRHVAKTILRTGEQEHADRKEKVAALTTGLQESGLKNLPIKGPGGGWRQEELAFYPPSSITNVKKGAQNYFQEARAAGRGKDETPAELSQTVQNSGAGETYYEDNQGEARSLLRQYNLGKADPVAVKNYRAAVAKAKSLGLKVGQPAPDVQAEPATHLIKVKATAQGSVQWLESLIGQSEGGAKIDRLAANFGLNAVTEPWCANLVSNNLARRGFKTSELPANPNYTPSYEEWGRAGKFATDLGTDLKRAKLGDVLTFSGQHTATYVGNGEMISGNFSNQVMRTPVSEGPAPLSMIIRPHYKGGFITVKETASLPGTVNPTGSISESSAAAVVSAVASPSTSGSGKQRESPKVRLSAPQRIAQAEKALQAGDLKAGQEAEAPTTSVLDELARKYGAAA